MGQEKNFENRVKKWLRDNGCYVVKYYGCGTTRAGVPDLLVCVNGRFVAVELKSDDGVVSQLQYRHIQRIIDSGGDALVLRPGEFEKFKAYIRRLMR